MSRKQNILYLLITVIIAHGYSGATIQAQTGCNAPNLDDIYVPLDDTGVGDWGFLNPRAPFPLIRKRNTTNQKAELSCWTLENLKNVDIQWANRTPNRTFSVEMDIEVPPPVEKISNILGWLELNATEQRILTVLPSTSHSDAGLEEEQRRDISKMNLLVQELNALRSQQTELFGSLESDPAELNAILQDIAKYQNELEELSEIISRRLERLRQVKSAHSDRGSFSQRVEAIHERIKQLAVSSDKLSILRKKLEDPSYSKIKFQTQDQIASQQEEVGSLSKQRKQLEIELLWQALERLDREARGNIMLEPNLFGEPARFGQPEKMASRLQAAAEQQHGTPLCREDNEEIQCQLKRALGKCRGALRQLSGDEIPSKSLIRRALNTCIDGPHTKGIAQILEAGGDELRWAIPRFEEMTVHLEALKDLVSTVSRFELGDISADADDLGERCKIDGNKQWKCKVYLEIGPRQAREIPGSTTALLRTTTGRTTFTVRFSGEAEIPSNSKGYFQTSANIKERSSSTQWKLAASSSYRRAPLYTSPDPNTGDTVGLELVPYDGDTTRELLGFGEFEIDKNLGDRAEGKATLAFKSGALGEDDQNREVEVSDYQVQIFGMNGSQFRFGKYKFLSSLVANPRGEGFELYYKGVSIGHILDRESLFGKADDADQDARISFLQLENLKVNWWDGARLDLFVVWGEDQAPESEAKYRSYGLKTYFGSSKYERLGWVPSADLELGFSEVKYGPQHTAFSGSGEGLSGVLSLRASDLVREGETRRAGLKLGEVERSAGLTLAFGEGDRQATENVNEGFLGTDAQFRPDKIFLSSLSPNLVDERSRPMPGLVNKTYVGIQTENREWSFLQYFWYWLNPHEKISSRSTRFSAHHYEFNNPVFGNRDIGYELDLEFRIESPKGVHSQLIFAKFFADDKFAYINSDPWMLEFKVSLSLSE